MKIVMSAEPIKAPAALARPKRQRLESAGSLIHMGRTTSAQQGPTTTAIHQATTSKANPRY